MNNTARKRELIAGVRDLATMIIAMREGEALCGRAGRAEANANVDFHCANNATIAQGLCRQLVELQS